MIKIISKSEAIDKKKFVDDFSELSDRVRQAPYRVGLLPKEVWQTFCLMPLPFPTEFWVAQVDDQTVGRIGANISPSQPGHGAVGFFEVDLVHPKVNEVVSQLLKTSEVWLQEKKVKQINGPLNFNTWFPYRFRVRENDEHKFSWEPVNPPEYVTFFQKAGFSELEGYHSQGLEGLDGVLEKTKPAYEAGISRGYTFRSFDGKNLLEKEVPRLYEISMAGFKDNFLFEPIPFDAFRQLYVPIANKLDVSLAHFAVNPQGREVGFFFVFNDQGYAVLKSVAVHPEARGLGISNGLTYAALKAARDQGISKLITALVKNGAQSESYGKKAKELWRHEYALFKKEV